MTVCQQMSSTDNLSKQFGPRTGLNKHQALFDNKLFDTLIIFLKEFFEKDDFLIRYPQTMKSMKNTQ